MKISPKKYAISLYESVQGKTKDEAKEIVGCLLAVLRANGDMRKADSIMEHFHAYWNKMAGLSSIEVTTAKGMDKSMRKDAEEYARNIFGAKEIEISEMVDPGILGGIIMREGDRIFDGSIKSRIYGLRERILK